MEKSKAAHPNVIILVSDKGNESRIKGQYVGRLSSGKQYDLGQHFGKFLFESGTSGFYQGLHDYLDMWQERLKEADEKRTEGIKFEIAVRDRAKGWCENCLSQGMKTKGTDAHHIWPKSTARKPNKWEPEQLPPGLEAWPHVEINGIYLCSACHIGAHGERRAKKGAGPGIRISRPYFYQLLRNIYPQRMFNGKSYKEWLADEPFRKWM